MTNLCLFQPLPIKKNILTLHLEGGDKYLLIKYEVHILKEFSWI